MKEILIIKHFYTKKKADKALITLGKTPPTAGGISERHHMLMSFSYSKLKSLL